MRIVAKKVMKPVVAAFLLTAGLCTARTAGAQPASASGQTGVKVTVYPILVAAPVFGASINLPAIPGGGGGGGGDNEAGPVSGSTDVALNAAYMAGIKVEANHWFAEASGTWAAVSAKRTRPRVEVETDTLFFSARGGVRLFRNVSATVGVRRARVDIDATLTLPDSEVTLEGHAKPGLWDPMLGVDWRGSLGDRWSIDASFQGGGFGVGSDVDLIGGVNASRHFGRHVDLRLGYEVVHYKITVADVAIGQFRRKLVATQTLHGPSVGLGIVF